jgi:hypothetical protein
MSADARIAVAFASHPKTKKVIRRLGEAGAWHVVCLILWAAANRSDGCLSGMSTEDIELAVDWRGTPGEFVATLASVAFLDGGEGRYVIHDWAEHNPWVNGSDMRSAKARWNAVKRHHGVREADRQVPEYAGRNATSTPNDASSNAASNAPSTVVAMLEPRRSNAPSPSPSPSQELKSPSGDLLQSEGESPPEDPIAVVVLDAYHAILPACQHIAVLNPKRQRRLHLADKLARQVCRQQGWAYDRTNFWRSYFEECLDDPWLRGEVANPRNPRWKQNLDVLIEEDRFAGIMDKAIASMSADRAA